MFGSVRAAQPSSIPVSSKLSAILEAPVRNVLIHINGSPMASNSSASHVRSGSLSDITACPYDVRLSLESGHPPDTRKCCDLKSHPMADFHNTSPTLP